MGKLRFKRQDLWSTLTSKDTIRFLWQRFVMMAGMDLRSIALFRFTMACCVIGDNIERMGDLFVLYTEEGLFPRSLIVSRYSSNYFFPIHIVNTSWTAQLIIFLIHTWIAFCMAIGFRTKLMTFLTWALTISLQSYVGVIGHGGDVYFRLMLFFCMFLPTAEFYSVDNWNFSQPKDSAGKDDDSVPLIDHEKIVDTNTSLDDSKKNDDAPIEIVGSMPDSSSSSPTSIASVSKKPLDPNRYRFISFATMCVLLQMSCMYIASFFHKSGEEWANGEATFYAISLDYFQTPFARWILPFRTTLKLLTIAVAKWELIGPLFWFSPVYTDYCRLLGAVGFMALHAGFVSCLRLGLFFWVTFFAQTCNFPPFVWDYTFDFCERKLMRGQRAVRVFYNTSSPLSQYLTLIMKTFFVLPSCATYAPLDKMPEEQSMTTVSTTPFASDDESSHKHKRLLGDDWFVSIDGNGVRRRNLAALNHLCSKSPLLFWLAWLCAKVPIGVTNVVSTIFQYCHSQSQASQQQTKRPSIYVRRRGPRRPAHRIYSIYTNVVCAFLFYLVLGYNLNIFHHQIPGWHFRYQQLAFLIRFDQGWNMFSPAPPKSHWWHAIHGELDDGTQVELFKDNAFHELATRVNYKVDFEKPVPFDTTYGNHRWFKFWENGYNAFGADSLRLETGRYVCRQFNSVNTGTKKLYRFTVFFVHEFMNLDGTVTPPAHQSLWNHLCYERTETKT
ncbi:hypothetical protein PPL_07807 [Heterostelium album PN500]|uniref:HTTM-like domain-containing protein n=1 Tax=Heterostelium pallidum (strain ATCC 26659 / Pp 5 / PN500) TaxID=670386 RepID=D3BH05_HETP5|nr:hypothetical protein PPL_07807 [Heterostelium album PN500]EFA79389.1 hypothetical protein PPL_07807 [Heterostelium album PN500]|eukprot:XP_020431510.1 hypothetical protein PPL_07807 [Heterostelium album PN500]